MKQVQWFSNIKNDCSADSRVKSRNAIPLSVVRTAVPARIALVYDDVSCNGLINMPRDVDDVLSIDVHNRVDIRDLTGNVAITIHTSRRANYWSWTTHENHLLF
jgi:hypothetical protein